MGLVETGKVKQVAGVPSGSAGQDDEGDIIRQAAPVVVQIGTVCRAETSAAVGLAWPPHQLIGGAGRCRDRWQGFSSHQAGARQLLRCAPGPRRGGRRRSRSRLART